MRGKNRNEYKILVRPKEGIWGGSHIDNTGKWVG
jgi:hypothetical protein